MNNAMMLICGYMLCAFLGLLGATILVWIWKGRIDLTALLAEANGDASMSRLQLLIFTFVIAVSLFYLVEKSASGTFPEIPSGILTLLGISASTYAVSKGISYSRDEGVQTDDQIKSAQNTQVAVAATAAAVAAAQAGMPEAAHAAAQTAAAAVANENISNISNG